MNLIAFRLLIASLLAACLLTAPAGVTGSWSSGMAWADDDDGGDDAGDDGDDDGRSRAKAASSGENGAKRPQRTIRPQAATPRNPAVAPALPGFLPEIIALGLAVDDVAVLSSEGFEIVESRTLAGIDATLIRIRPPAGQPLAAARDRVRLLPSGADADVNHLYRTNQEPLPASGAATGQLVTGRDCTHANCAAHALIGWPDSETRGAACPSPLLQIGIIDTGVNDRHDLLETGRIAISRLAPDQMDASGQTHGTAVVSVLAGAVGDRIEGLLPEARLLVADVFSTQNGDERADAFP